MQVLTELRPTVLSLLDREDSLPDIEKIWRVLALYCCRLIGRRQFRVWVHSTYRGKQGMKDALLDLKDRLDNNSLPNRVLRAVVDINQHQRRLQSHYSKAAARHHLALNDLILLERSLTTTERAEIKKRWKTGVGKELSQRCKTDLVKHYRKVTQYLVHRYLSYVYNNDPAIQFSDLCSDMDAEVTRLAMVYEVYLPRTYSAEHFFRSVHRGLLNYVKNLAKLHGRKSRCGVERVHKAPTTRKLVYLSTGLKIYRVVVSMKQEARRCVDGRLETLALLRSGKTRWVPITELYTSVRDARLERFRRLQNCGPSKHTIPSLAPHDIDDFRLTARSLDAPVASGDDSKEVSLHELLVAPSEDTGRSFLVDLSRAGASFNLQEFAKIVIGDSSNQVFAKWLHVYKGKEVGVLSEEQLGQHVAKWLGTSLSQLRSDLADTKESMWGKRSLDLLDAYLDEAQPEIKEG